MKLKFFISENLYDSYRNLSPEEKKMFKRPYVAKGRIYPVDLEDYGEKYDLPDGIVSMVKTGEWIGARGRKIGCWKFADGSHENLQFDRDARNGIFYLEAID